MAETFQIKVDLLTKQAKRALKRLRQQRNQTRTTARSRIKTATKRRAKNLIGFLGGWAAVNRVTRKMRGADGQVDPWVGAMIPIQAKLQQFIDEKVGFSANARRAARNDTVQALAMGVGMGVTSKQAIREVFSYHDNIRQAQAKGRNIVRQAIKGPSLDELIVAATKGFFKLSGRAWAYVWDSIFN